MPYHDVEFEVRDPDGYIVVVSEWLEARQRHPGVAPTTGGIGNA